MYISLHYPATRINLEEHSDSATKHFNIMKTTLTIDNDGILTFPDELLKEIG